MARTRRKGTGDGAARAAPSSMGVTEQRAAAHEAALRLLAVRERSTAELTERLVRKGFLAEVASDVLDSLTRAGLVDDVRFAEGYAREAVSRGHAGRRIRLDLRRRGLGPDLAAAATAEPPEAEEDRARALAFAKADRLSGLDAAAISRRVLGLLARRGFDPETARRVAAEAAERAAGTATDLDAHDIP